MSTPNHMGVGPYSAYNEYLNAQNQFNDELIRFDALAKSNPGIALMYFIGSMFGTLMTYQGSEMDLQSAMMNATSVLNNELSNMQSAFSKVINDFNDGSVRHGAGADVKAFMNDAAHLMTDLEKFFSNVHSNAPYLFHQGLPNPFASSGAQLISSIVNDLNVFQPSTEGLGSAIQGVLESGADPHNFSTDEVYGVTNQIYEAWANGYAADGSGGSEVKTLQDTFGNISSSLGQPGQTAGMNLQSDQSVLQELEGMLSNVSKGIIQFYQNANQGMTPS